MNYKILATKSFQKDFQKIKNKKLKNNIKKELQKLSKNPYKGKKLINLKIGQFRIRIGDYRIRYDIFQKEVVLHRLRHRKDIYRK